MSALAPTLERYFTERLVGQKGASPHTVAAYADTLRLLLVFAQDRTGKAPSALDFSDLNAPLIGAFLDHLEHDRHNGVRTRNARLAAVHSLFRFAALCHPEHAGLISRVLAIPPKRSVRTDICFLETEEVAAILAAPDPERWVGRRDHALLLVAVQTGLRVSELTGLCCGDVELGRGAHVRCEGKGRKRRCTPLTAQTAAVLRVWLAERNGGPGDPLFPTSTGRRLSRDAVALVLAKYANVAEQRCPSLKAKTLTPHVLRHSCAMALHREGVSEPVIALWLGHESVATVQIYVHADLGIKERALARTTPPPTTPGRYKARDPLLAFLQSL
ncbi:MAG TPA: tyrosine-type recombinase/integrase [Acidimicrobiales bacterium]|nr:tyrosine-type recombinase/integrase [Acidimicrobiales bacterium]